jgi:hypothetical protein
MAAMQRLALTARRADDPVPDIRSMVAIRHDLERPAPLVGTICGGELHPSQARVLRRGSTVVPGHVTLPALHACQDELQRLLAGSGWPARIIQAAARPGYDRLERRAFGRHHWRDGYAQP